jgi:serine/threonine protein kinase
VARDEQDRILAEIRVLKALKHKNIMSFYKWWYNEEKGQVCATCMMK